MTCALFPQKRSKLEVEPEFDFASHEELRIVEGQRTDPDTSMIEGEILAVFTLPWQALVGPTVSRGSGTSTLN